MSADDGYIIRMNERRQYVLQHYFASCDSLPDIDDPRAEVYARLGEAVMAFEKHDSEYPSEYGLRVSINRPTPSRNTTTIRNGSKMLETQQYERIPFPVSVARVTPENLEKVAIWCGGEVRTIDKSDGSSVSYVHVKVNRPLNPRQTQAFVGDRVLHTETGFKVYTDRAFEGAFRLLSPEVVLVDGPAAEVGSTSRKESPKRSAAKKKAASRTLSPRPGVVKKVTPATVAAAPRTVVSGPAVVDATGETVGVVDEPATVIPFTDTQSVADDLVRDGSVSVVDGDITPREVVVDNVH